MKSFSVEQIAELLNTNPETVRRWIRNDKLHATKSSNKSGWVVSEEELTSFIGKSKKYSGIATSIVALSSAAGAIGLLPLAGVSGALAAGTAIASIISAASNGKKIEGVDKKALSAIIESSIIAHRVVIDQKNGEIESLEEKIQALKKEIEKEEEIIDNLKAFQQEPE